MPLISDAALDSLVPRLIEIRHDIHRHPELGFEEHRTQALVMDWLRECGLEPRTMVGTGVLADLPATAGRVNPKTVALRADMDCLPIHEHTPLPYRSLTAGQSHKCGHDGHTTILMGVAQALASVRDRLPVNVRLIFQPAEEGVDGGGATRMVDAGALQGVDEVYGLHNWPGYPSGQLRVRPGITMAEVSDFDFKVTGRGGHASQPQLCRDPVLAASALVVALHAMMSRCVGAGGGAVLSVCQVQAGEARNAIPDVVELAGRVVDGRTDPRLVG